MTLSADTDAKLQSYAHPARLVTTQWLEDNLGTPDLVVLESNEDVLLFHTGHIPARRTHRCKALRTDVIAPRPQRPDDARLHQS